jgi:hypothetical protein
MMNDNIGIPLLAALFISLRTCGELAELVDSINTKTRQFSIASIIASAKSLPGRISLGAIQQFILFDSSVTQTAFAIRLFTDA